MKKFFSLVLALVMALSLATVAWGATETVTTSTMSAQRTIASGEDVVLTADSPVTITVDSACVDAFVIEAGGKLTIGKNVTITGAGALIWVNGGELVIEGKVVSTGATYGTICVSGDTAVVDVEDGAVVHSEGNTAIGIDHLGNTVPSAGAVVNVNGGTVSTDAYSALFGYTGTINVYGGEIYTENATSVALIAAGGACTVNMYGGTVESVLAHEGAGATANIYGGTVTGSVAAANGATVAISGGTFSDDVSEYVVPGMSLVGGAVVNNAGLFVGSSSALTSSKATYGTTVAAALANKTETVEVKAGLAASTSLKTFQTYQVFVTTTATGTVAVLPNQYVIVPTETNADIVVVDGSKIVYLAEVGSGVKYTDVAKAVKVAYNAKPACGDVYVAAAADAGTYYLYKDAYYVECADADATILFSVDGMAVCAKETTLVKTLPHTYDYDAKAVTGGKTVVTSVFCTACKTNFSFIEGTVEDAVKAFGAGNYADTGLNNVKDIFVRTAATVVGTVVTPSTDKVVESAQTFDAGIAMYVGMSVMAAAGSAVVIGKKKD